VSIDVCRKAQSASRKEKESVEAFERKTSRSGVWMRRKNTRFD
jgi:hypothetical protein